MVTCNIRNSLLKLCSGSGLIRSNMYKLKIVTLVLVAFCILMPLAKLSAVQAKDISVSQIRFGKLSNGSNRIVLDTTGKINPKIMMLANPYRIVVDMPKVKWTMKGKSKPSNLINQYRHNSFSSDTYRLVLDLKSSAIVANQFSLPPGRGYSHRYVIDLKPVSRRQFLISAKNTATTPLSRPKATKSAKKYKPRKTGKKVIVIAPGHGGRDVGTLGRYGAHESVLTLKIANQLKSMLEATGKYKVYLTRTGKKTFHKVKSRDLRMRYEFARKYKADLLVAIHVDAAGNSKTRGGSVYTLSEKASDQETARLVAKENSVDFLPSIGSKATDPQVKDILVELAQRETLNYSAQLAELMVIEMRKQVKMLKTAHRYGPFMVLKAPDIPSILIETGFQTNKTDAKVLNSTWGRKKLTLGIKNGIDSYFRTVKTAMAN